MTFQVLELALIAHYLIPGTLEGGADIRPMVAAPGDIVFDLNNGIFNVNFTVTNSLGAHCTDTITV